MPDEEYIYIEQDDAVQADVDLYDQTQAKGGDISGDIVVTGKIEGSIDVSNVHGLASVATSGNYADLTGTPTEFEGATASADGKQGLVPAPEAGDQDKVLKGDGTWGTASVSSIDASAITSGTIDLARLPAGALERLVTVADQTARFALTTADVQLGDTVKQSDTGVMYLVVDTTKLNQGAGYVEFTAGSAASVPWSGVTGKPSSFTPSSHTHTGTEVALTGYSKPSAASAIAATDTVDTAVGKLEKALDGKADDSAAVHKTGDEAIDGTKTFSSTISGSVSGNAGTATKIQGAPTGTSWVAGATAGGALVSSTATSYGAVLNAPTKNYRVSIGTFPSGSNNVYLLSVSKTNVEAGTNTISKQMTWDASDGTLTTAAFSGTVLTSSDERLKTPLNGIPDAVLDAWEDVQWGEFQYLDAVDCKGENARLHLGLVAQCVKAAFKARGLDACQYGILCRDTSDGMWSVRYAEALAMEAACQRRRADRLEARIAEIEARLTAMEVANA